MISSEHFNIHLFAFLPRFSSICIFATFAFWGYLSLFLMDINRRHRLLRAEKKEIEIFFRTFFLAYLRLNICAVPTARRSVDSGEYENNNNAVHCIN